MPPSKKKPSGADDARRRLANKFFSGTQGVSLRESGKNVGAEGGRPDSKMVGREPMKRRMAEHLEAKGSIPDYKNRKSEVIEALKGSGDIDDKKYKKLKKGNR